MPNAVVYFRVSTKTQAEQGSSLESQRDACVLLAKERGLEPMHVLLEDESGAELDRPLLTKARELVKSGQAKALVCYSTDRLARNPIHIAIIAEECQKAGAELLFVTEPLDVSPEGQLIAYVKGYAAQIEREKIRDRMMRGIRARVLGGKLPHEYGKGVYGYRYNRETGWRELYEPEARWVRQMYRWLVEDGLTITAICHRLGACGVATARGGLWRTGTVWQMLRNPVYKGVTHAFKSRNGSRRYRDPKDWIELPNATPAIVSEELWEAAQARTRRNLELSRRAAKKEYLLSGYLFCGDCGRRMYGCYLVGAKRRYYRCSGRDSNVYRPGQTCGQPQLRADEAEAWAWEAVTNILQQPELILAELERLSDREALVLIESRLADLEREIHATRSDEQRLVRLYAYGEIDDEFILRETRRFKAERSGLEDERAKLQAQRQERLDVEKARVGVEQLVRRVAANLESFGYQDKRLALEALRTRVSVQEDGSLDMRVAVPVTFARA